MNIVALDIATLTGWAANLGDILDYSNVELHSEGRLRKARKARLDRRLDPRVPALYDYAKGLVRDYRADLVVFEDVRFIRSTKQGQLWPSLRAAVWLAARHTDTQIDCLDTGALKTFATGGNNASKARMEAALKDRMSGLDFGRMDDNMVDAVWLWLWAKETFKQ